MGLKLISCDIKSVHRVFDHNEICLFTKNENLPVVQSLLGHPLKKKRQKWNDCELSAVFACHFSILIIGPMYSAPQ